MGEQIREKTAQGGAAHVRKVTPGDGKITQADALAGGEDLLGGVRLREGGEQAGTLRAFGGEELLPAKAGIGRGPVGTRRLAEAEKERLIRRYAGFLESIKNRKSRHRWWRTTK